MKSVDVSKARGPLARYARRVHREDQSLVIVDSGEPVALVVPLQDLESLSVSMNPQFVALIEASRRRCRAGNGISLAEVGRRLAADAPRRRVTTRTK